MSDSKRAATLCPACGKPMAESDAYLDSILRRRGFMFCMTESCPQPTIGKPLAALNPTPERTNDDQG